jgi:hypothetical protein
MNNRLQELNALLVVFTGPVLVDFLVLIKYISIRRAVDMVQNGGRYLSDKWTGTVNLACLATVLELVVTCYTK